MARDNVIYDKDAKYFYYAHGPLARVELGENKVQGIDYAYTLQGWIKGVNSNTLDSLLDIGRDGAKMPLIPTNPNAHFAKDVFGYSLGYFEDDASTTSLTEDDYSSIDASKNSFIASVNSSVLLGNRKNLYNGNIGMMVTTITDPATRKALPNGNAYKYDQLNRLLESKSFKNMDLNPQNTTTYNTWASTGTYNNEYYNSFTYDASGNIFTQKRHDASGTAIENMNYGYKRNLTTSQLLQNRLYHVDDNVGPTAFEDDIDDMGTLQNPANPTPINNINTLNNYSYDAEGRLIRDKQEGIALIDWMVTGKVKRVLRTPGFSKVVNATTFYPSDLEFNYDVSGNRIAKIEKPRKQTTGQLLPAPNWITTYYVRDAQGNPISVYKLSAPANATSYKQIEKHIYGSSRVGMEVTEIEMISPVTSTYFTHVLGNKYFEGSNHLGNVLTVITDKKIPVDDSDHDSDNDGKNDFTASVANSADGIVDYMKAELLLSTDYFSFGVAMKGRDFSSAKFRYGMNSQERDDEITGNSGTHYSALYWEYDARLGRRWNLDPEPITGISDYACFTNNPVALSDVLGNTVDVGKKQEEKKKIEMREGDTYKPTGEMQISGAGLAGSYKKIVVDADGKELSDKQIKKINKYNAKIEKENIEIRAKNAEIDKKIALFQDAGFTSDYNAKTGLLENAKKIDDAPLSEYQQALFSTINNKDVYTLSVGGENAFSFGAKSSGMVSASVLANPNKPVVQQVIAADAQEFLGIRSSQDAAFQIFAGGVMSNKNKPTVYFDANKIHLNYTFKTKTLTRKIPYEFQLTK